METITLNKEEVAKYFPPERHLSEREIIGYLKEHMRWEDEIRKWVQGKWKGEVSERVRNGRYILEFRPIYKPIITKESLCQILKSVQHSRFKGHYRVFSDLLLSAWVVSLWLSHLILPYDFFFQKPTSLWSREQS